jgi:hypothetical protein
LNVEGLVEAIARVPEHAVVADRAAIHAIANRPHLSKRAGEVADGSTLQGADITGAYARVNSVKSAHHIDSLCRIRAGYRHCGSITPGLSISVHTQLCATNARHGAIHATLTDRSTQQTAIQTLILNVELLQIARTQVAAAHLGGRGAQIARVLVLARGVYDVERVGEVAHGGNLGYIGRACARGGERLYAEVGRVNVDGLRGSAGDNQLAILTNRLLVDRIAEVGRGRVGHSLRNVRRVCWVVCAVHTRIVRLNVALTAYCVLTRGCGRWLACSGGHCRGNALPLHIQHVLVARADVGEA